MKKSKALFLILSLLVSFVTAGCGSNTSPSDSTEPDQSVTSIPTKQNSDTYMDNIKMVSLHNHLYIHYYRFDNKVSSYSDWMVWAFNDRDGYGTRFDWNGRTQVDLNTVTGDATIDEVGAFVDIDLSATYVAMQTWGREGNIISVGENSFNKSSLMISILKVTPESTGNRKNDGESVTINLLNYKISLSDDNFSYHVFLIQGDTYNPLSKPTFLD